MVFTICCYLLWGKSKIKFLTSIESLLTSEYPAVTIFRILAPPLTLSLYIRGISCPRSVQTSLTLDFKKIAYVKYWPRYQASKCLYCLRAPLPSASYSSDWSGWVRKPNGDTNSCLHTFFLHQTAIIICRGLPHPTQQGHIYKKVAKWSFNLQRAVVPDEGHIMAFFLR